MKTKFPDSLTIQQYLEGKLDPQVAHKLEKEALDDPFLWDALEGYSMYKDPADDLSILQRQLHERVVHMQENKKVFDLSWQRLSVAAAAAVMFVSAGILFWMNSHNPKEQLASQSQNPVEVQFLDKDTVEAIIKEQDQPALATLTKKPADLNRPPVPEVRRANPASKKAMMPPKAEEAFAANQGLAAAPESQGQVAVAASAAAPAAKARKVQDATGELNENVVAANTSPKNGWPAYREYLMLNTNKFKSDPSIHGSVLISFQIAADGKVSNPKIVRGLNEAYDREALRIVRNGPDWTPSPLGKVIEHVVEVAF